MTAVVKSQLNPLANVFIPTTYQSGLQKKPMQHLNKKKNRLTGDANRNKNSSDSKSVYNSKEMAITLDMRETPGWNDIFFFGRISSLFNIFLNSKLMFDKPACMIKDSRLPVLQVCQRDDQELVKKPNIDLIKIPKDVVEEKIECNCPAMFGWIIPPEFIGNPLNLKFDCSKKYPHSSKSIKKESDIDKLDTYDKIDNMTLDECYSEIKDILGDIYKSISMESVPISKWEGKSEIEDFPEVSDCEKRNEERINSKHTSSDSTSEVATKLELVDDGYHPLLQSAPLTREEDQKELIENIEKMLERSLSSSLPESLDSATLYQRAVCDPPCSVWCDFLPSAKDSFKKYIPKSGNDREFNKACQLPSGHRPLYKRSFSADDARMFGRFNQGLNQASPVDSREMLLLRRKDPLNYFRIRSSNTLINGMKVGSFNLKNPQSFVNSNVNESKMWGKFFGSDSLWKPLPDCMPANVNQNQNCRKRS